MLLMILAYRGVNVIVLAPLMSAVAVAFDAGAPILASYTQIFMPAMGRFIANYFPLFALGAVFGRLMEKSGAMSVIADHISSLCGDRRAIWATVATCAVLTYCGISVFVVVFAVFPLSSELFRRANIPLRLLPAAIALGAFTFTMTALPGSLQIHNLIPMKYFGTSVFASPVLGFLGAALMLSFGMSWLAYRAKAARRLGEGYEGGPASASLSTTSRSFASLACSVAPICVVIVVNFALSEIVFPNSSFAYLEEKKYGAISIQDVRGLWATIVALLAAIACILLIYYRRVPDIIKGIVDGVNSSLSPVFNTASEVGYGATIASLTGFAVVRASVLNIAPNSVLISQFVSINLLAGITGSASGGLTIALESLGAEYVDRAASTGTNIDVLHRVASMSSCGLDTLPHNGAVITLLLICGLSHRQAYKDIFMTSVAVPLVSTEIVVVIAEWSRNW